MTKEREAGGRCGPLERSLSAGSSSNNHNDDGKSQYRFPDNSSDIHKVINSTCDFDHDNSNSDVDTSNDNHNNRSSSSSSNNNNNNGNKKHRDAVVTVSSTRFWLLSFGAYVGLFLALMDASIVAASLHTIASDFKVFISINWIALGYTLAECSCCIVFARVSDVIGRRNCFLSAKAIFFISSLAAGFAQDIHQLIAFRVMQGIGGSGLYSLALILMTEVCPDHLLEYMAGLAGVIVVIAGIAGPVLGGLLTQYTSWRWVFWINCPICIVSVSCILVFWPKDEQILLPPRRPWKDFDYIGSILLIAANVLLIFAFQNVGVSTIKGIWGQSIFIVPIVMGITCLFALFSWAYITEHRPSANRIMTIFPLSLFKNRHYACGIVTTLFVGFPLFYIIFTVPLRSQIVSGKSPLSAALMLLPMLVGTSSGCVLCAIFNARRNFLFESMLGGSILSLVGCSLLSTIHGSPDDHKMLGYLVIAGVGIGLTIASSTGNTGVEISPRNYAPAQGILSQVRILGGSFGISTSSVLLHNQIVNRIPGPITPQMLALLSDANSHLPPQLQALASLGTSEAFRNGMLICAVLSGASALFSLVGFRTRHENTKQQRLNLIRADMELKHEEEKAEEAVRVFNV